MGACRTLACLVLLSLPGCVSVEKDTTQCVIQDDGFGGTRTVFDPSQRCNDRDMWDWWAPDVRDVEVNETSPGVLTVTQLEESHGPRDWSEFTLFVGRDDWDAPQVHWGFSSGAMSPQAVPPEGARMPAKAAQVGDQIHLCVEGQAATFVGVEFQVDHPRAYRIVHRVHRVPVCPSGVAPDPIPSSPAPFGAP